MNSILIFWLGLICCWCLTLAAPVENGPGVQFVKYKDDNDFEEIQRQIIAQYEHLGGSSQVHHIQTAQIVDPNNLKISLS